MKTTIDLPEALLHRAKIVAAQRKTTLKELVVQGLNYATRLDPGTEEDQRREKALRLISALQAKNTEPIRPLKRAEIYTRQTRQDGPRSR